MPQESLRLSCTLSPPSRCQSAAVASLFLPAAASYLCNNIHPLGSRGPASIYLIGLCRQGAMARQSQNHGQGQGQNGRSTRNITGPQSALTDFLASHNISARQIRDDAEQCRRRAAAQAQQDEQEATATVTESSTGRRRTARHDRRGDKAKTKVEHGKAVEKAKTARAPKKGKRRPPDSDDDYESARAIFGMNDAPLPGQIENCAICGKRFTVTPYSVTAPDGGLLCAPCGKELAKERQGQPKKKPRKQVGGVGSRRSLQSRILDGDVGTKSLATLCVQTLAKNVDMADSLGDLPEHLIDKIARLFSKRRLLRPETLPLFLQPTTQTLHIYDGANLGGQDFIGAFQVARNLRRFKARSAIQFKDEVMDYLLSRDIALESFYLHGANLLSEQKWHEFLAAKGQGLKGLQVYYTDNHFGDESIEAVATHCPNLQRFKVENNQKLTGKGVESIGTLVSLEHLGLQLQTRISPAAVINVVSKIGHKLKTLSLKIVPDADDTVLQAIHEHCCALNKLRITDSEKMTDQGFVDFFTGWKNPPLQFLDLQKCRYVDSARPRHNDDGIGLCSEGFKALMAHSGPKLEHLNVHACRNIGRGALEEVFREDALYPELKKLEICFCEEVTDFILGCVFRACPKIKEVNVFGCMKIKEVRVPRWLGFPTRRAWLPREWTEFHMR